MAFSSSLSQSKFGKDPCWEPWDSSGDSRAAYAVSKKPIGFLQISTSLQAGLPRMAMP